MDYDEHNPFVVCSRSFIPLYRGNPQILCPFCGASYAPNFNGTLCSVCEVSTVGTVCTGIKICVRESNDKF